MNAYQFIKQDGLNKAREIADGAPETATYYVFWTGKVRYINDATSEIYSEKYGGWCAANVMVLNLKNSLSELKQAITDWELVKEFYGLTKAKEYASSPYTAPEIKSVLEAAIKRIEDGARS